MLAFAAVVTLGLTACTSGDEPNGEKTPSASAAASTRPITITYAYEQEFQAYNPNTGEQYAALNIIPLNQVLRGFSYFTPQGKVQPDTEFGTFTKTSDSPLTVRYTFSPKAAWSDGQPIDCDDAVLVWAANSGRFVTGKKDSEGNPVSVFSAPGYTGYENFDRPQCKDGEKTFTVTYTKPFVDWNALFGSTTFVPAHIVERESGVADLIAAVDAKDMAALTKAGRFYNEGWVLKKGELKPEISPAAGPYQLSAWTAGQSLTLKANPKWWGTPPLAETVVIRFIKQDQQAKALQNGEIQLMDPQPNPELVKQLQGIGNTVRVSQHDQHVYENVTFNLRKGSPLADRELREAFAKCLPRQQIVDNLIKPQNPNAVVMNARYLYPYQEGYAKLVAASVGTAYDTVDIAAAKAIIDRKGKKGMRLRIGYIAPNPRRTSEVELIRDSCGQAGFTIVDGGSEDFYGEAIQSGTFDVALFGWQGSGLVSESSASYSTGAMNNVGRYSNPEVDTLLERLGAAVNPAEQTDLVTQVETILWKDLQSIPLFAFPGILATSSTVENVTFNPSQNGLTWNMNRWNLTTQ